MSAGNTPMGYSGEVRGLLLTWLALTLLQEALESPVIGGVWVDLWEEGTPQA